LLKLWNTQSGVLIRSEKKHTDWITALDISPDGILLASGDRNGGVTAFAFAKDGTFVTAGRDNNAKIWKVDFNMLREIQLPALATAAAVDFESRRAFVADSLGRVHAFAAEEKGSADLTSFPTNPPPIATRLEQIGRRICELHGTKDAPPDAAANAEIAALRSQEKTWSAAAINTHALRAETETANLTGKSEDEIETFLASVADLSDPTSQLNAKRTTRDAYAASIEGTALSDPHREEALATLRALDASVKNLWDTLHEKELAFAAVRHSSDTTVKSLAETKSQATHLRSTYIKALK
jgi:hypothetical protein